MAFDYNKFISDFKKDLKKTKGKIQTVYGTKESTSRIYSATDYACKQQTDFFSIKGTSRYKSTKKNNEFMLDYTYLTEQNKIILALESEMGKSGSGPETIKLVHEDFIKIINFLSPVKIMVFRYKLYSSDKQNNEEECLNAMKETLIDWNQKELQTLISISFPWNDGEIDAKDMKAYLWSKKRWQLI